MISADSLGEDTFAILVNTVYFKGNSGHNVLLFSIIFKLIIYLNFSLVGKKIYQNKTKRRISTVSKENN